MTGVTFDPKRNLFGTTSAGGYRDFGVLFEISQHYHDYTVIHKFTGGTDGATPLSSPLADSKGNLYGTMANGGQNDNGYAYRYTHAGGIWNKSLLYEFQGGADGAHPYGELISDGAGNLYGTTDDGGTSDLGTVFKLTAPPGGVGPWIETVLYSFGGGTDGGFPRAGLTLDSAGNLYGTTQSGGGLGSCGNGTQGCGTVFKLAPSGGSWTETVLYRFAGGDDGGEPESGVTLDAAGNLYGTTMSQGHSGKGVVFEVLP